jgi:hypothetical protein
MRTTVPIICILAMATLAVCLAIERQASSKLELENNALRGRLGQRAELLAENQSLSNLLAEATPAPSRPSGSAVASPARSGAAQELARLRREVEALRQQSKEIETLRANTRETRAAAETAVRNARAANTPGTGTTNGSQLEVLRADYWTDHTSMDVAAELRERIRGDSLKAIASNNLRGDPEFGQVKHLTVVYRFGGVTMTNEFREGDFVVLPGELGK